MGSPFVDENIIAAADYERPGVLGDVACSILMKALYAARLARPDLLKAITELSAFITKWDRACDIKTLRLSSYLHHNLEFEFVLRVGSHPSTMRLTQYADADLSGENLHAPVYGRKQFK